jgi:glutamate 5-kinase
LHIKGQSDSEIAETYGYSPISEVIHRDDLMMMEKS